LIHFKINRGEDTGGISVESDSQLEAWESILSVFDPFFYPEESFLFPEQEAPINIPV
jgi:hypothetical protein